MKILFLLSALCLPSATASNSSRNLRRLQTQQCLTGLDQITFQSACTHESVEANVATALGATCGHTALDEIKLLSANTHSWQAKQFLVDHCNTLEFDPCLTLASVAFRANCDHTSVYEDLESALTAPGVTCDHGVDKELKLLTDNNNSWQAKGVLTTHCKALDHSPCLEEAQIAFTSACSTDSVVDDIEDALITLGSCSHEALREVELLADNNNQWQAKVALTVVCESRDHSPCLDKTAIDFTSTCSTDSVALDVEDAVAALDSCPHEAQREVELLADNNNQWQAKVALSGFCKSLDHAPCLTLTTMSFTSSCSTDSVQQDVTNALAGSSCPHDSSREMVLLMNQENAWTAKTELAKHCETLDHGPCLVKATIDFTSTCSTDSVLVDVRNALTALGSCPHEAEREVELLADNDNQWQAKVALSGFCGTLDHSPCLDEAAIDFTSACSTDSVIIDVEDALIALGSCPHEAEREVALLADNNNNWQAKVAMTVVCKSRVHSPCLDKATIDFTSTCSTDSVLVDVQNALTARGSCPHEAEREVELLAENDNQWQAKVALTVVCESRVHSSCLDKASIDFTSTCSTDSVLVDVQNALTALGSCPHEAEREVELLAENDNQWQAKVALAGFCDSLEHSSCLDKATIDFTSTCSTDSVAADVANALIARGSCPHGAEREVELLAGNNNQWQAKVALTEFCETLDHGPCLVKTTIDFTSTCSTDSVLVDVRNALTALGSCPHEAEREVELLAENDNQWQAKVALTTHCKALDHSPCLNEAQIAFTSACTTDSVVDDVEDALITLGSCSHEALREVELLADNNNQWQAKVALTVVCESRDHSPCLDKIAIGFSSTCSTDSVVVDVRNALTALGSCTHEAEREVELLAENDNQWQAKVALKDYCRTLDHTACLDLTTLVFPNCVDATFVSVIETALVAAACAHDLQMELLIHTGNPNSWQSKQQVINTVCVSSLTPCLSVDQLLIFNCDRSLVTDVVTAALPSTCTHDVEQEIKLLGNSTHSWQASVAVSEECHEYVQPCTSLTMQDYIVDNCKNPLNVVKDILATTTCPTHDKHTMEIIALTGMPDVTSAVDFLKAECIDARVSCTKDIWDNTMVNGCDLSSIVQAVKDQMELPEATCYHSWETEIELLTGSAVDDQEAAKSFITTICGDAWEGVTTSKFTEINTVFDDTFMEQYTMGDTFLNTETGNFQGVENPAYPDSQMDPRTRQVGADIDYFLNGDDDGDRDGVGATTILQSFPALEFCETAILCCFGRDRQSEDNNGDCNQNDCDNKGPGDNSNLCYVDEPGFMAYPNDSEESIHCHGVTWSEDMNDFSQRLRFNNMFFVSLYDHMYSRGYVEPMIEDNQVLPMCDCIEEMPPVVRSDCTQLDVELNFAMNTDAAGLLTAVTQDDMKIAFNACSGSPNNDLAAYAKKLLRHKEISEAKFDTILDTLVGEIGGGNDQEGACQNEVDAFTSS